MQDQNSQLTIHINLNTVMLFVVDSMLLVSMFSTQSSTFQAKVMFAIIYIILFSAIEHLPRVYLVKKIIQQILISNTFCTNYLN